MSEAVGIEKNSEKKRKEGKNRKGIIIAVATIAITGIVINKFNETQIYCDTIAKNIFVEDVDLSQMTKDEALKAVYSEYAPKDMMLLYEEKKYEIKPQDIDLMYNIEQTVEEAYNYTKTDKYFDNIYRYFNLKRNKKEIQLTSKYDEVKLSENIKNISDDVNREMVNAKVHISSSGGISTTESITGRELDIASTEESILDNIKNKKFDEIKLNVKLTQPYIKTEDAQSVDTLLGQFSTRFSSAPGRVRNIQIAAQKGSNILLMPGEEYSYNKLTGPRNRANGYKDAPVIVNGKLEDGIGGGVCQVSTTLYNAVLYSGATLTSITNHSLLSTYVPIGRDAMVNDGSTDFRFKNPYDHPIYVKMMAGNSSVTARIYGNSKDKQKIDIKVDAFKEGGLNASNTYRLYKDSNGNVIKKEFIDKSVYRKPKK